jgi:2-polyprenyl-3-methyl-5-hydroxy-6-metoxy-1,4-benzoquinol methylase
VNYISQIFTPTSLEHAKNICLTPDQNDPNKFVNETNFLINFLKENQLVLKETNVADFGCGMGRVSKQLIEQIGCNVVGFDISYPMLLAAKNYINNDKFVIKKYNTHIKEQYTKQFDVIISSFVLQHSEHPEFDINFIKNSLKADGIFILVNEEKRFIPIDIENNNVIWHDDKIVINKLVSNYFKCSGEFSYYKRQDKCLTIWKNKINQII